VACERGKPPNDADRHGLRHSSGAILRARSTASGLPARRMSCRPPLWPQRAPWPRTDALRSTRRS
jgi:hypothetical protein